jgi:ATP-dependent DNA helicase RecQ
MGRTGLARALQGARSSPVNPDRFRLFGALSGTTQKRIIEIADELVQRGLLQQYTKGAYPLLRLTTEGEAWLESHPPGVQAAAEPPVAPQTGDGPQEHEEALYERLRAWRTETAQAIGKPAYVVLTNSTLQALAAARPANLPEMAAIKGIGPHKLEQYGQAVLDLLAARDPDQTHED